MNNAIFAHITMKVWILVVFCSFATAFQAPAPLSSRRLVSFSFKTSKSSLLASNTDEDDSFGIVPKILPTALTSWLVTSLPALADGPDWGLFEGRTGSLLHPISMGSLLLFSIYTALLGFQWRRQRTMGDEISALKKTIPNLDGASSVSVALQAAKSAETVDQSKVNALQAALSIEQQVADLQKERKTLSEAGPRDRHYSQGAVLVFIGTLFAIVGPLNTYARAGKLFPGPHLYAGAGVVVLWALAASCVPSMIKGNDTARSVHVAANLGWLGLFGWQVVSGIPILLKVIEKTSWP